MKKRTLNRYRVTLFDGALKHTEELNAFGDAQALLDAVKAVVNRGATISINVRFAITKLKARRQRAVVDLAS